MPIGLHTNANTSYEKVKAWMPMFLYQRLLPIVHVKYHRTNAKLDWAICILAKEWMPIGLRECQHILRKSKSINANVPTKRPLPIVCSIKYQWTNAKAWLRNMHTNYQCADLPTGLHTNANTSHAKVKALMPMFPLQRLMHNNKVEYWDERWSVFEQIAYLPRSECQ